MPCPAAAAGRPSMPDLAPLHPVSRAASRRLTDERRDHAARDRVAARTRPTATASTTSPGPSRSTCSTRASLGWPAVAESAWRRACASSTTRSTRRRGRFRNFRSTSTGRGSAASAPTTATGGRCTRSATPSRPPPTPSCVDARRSLFERALPAARRAHVAPRRGVRRPRLRRDRCGPRRTRDRRRPAARLLADATACDRFQRLGRRRRLAMAGMSVTYENALLPRALIVAGTALASDADGRHRPAASLDWLIDAQTSPDGHLSPIGNGWWPRGRREVPVRPAADRGDGAAARRRVGRTGDRRRALPRRRWSAPTRGSSARTTSACTVADPARGAGCDGLTPTGSTRTRAPSRR